MTLLSCSTITQLPHSRRHSAAATSRSPTPSARTISSRCSLQRHEFCHHRWRAVRRRFRRRQSSAMATKTLTIPQGLVAGHLIFNTDTRDFLTVDYANRAAFHHVPIVYHGGKRTVATSSSLGGRHLRHGDGDYRPLVRVTWKPSFARHHRRRHHDRHDWSRRPCLRRPDRSTITNLILNLPNGDSAVGRRRRSLERDFADPQHFRVRLRDDDVQQHDHLAHGQRAPPPILLTLAALPDFTKALDDRQHGRDGQPQCPT